MITHPAFPTEPWALRETELQLDSRLAQTESIFALSNGHVGWRGNLDEGEPHGLPGSYLNGVHEDRPLPWSERGYGFPESGETMINVTNGKIIRLLVNDEPFDVRYGTLRSHERVLDFRAGVLDRRAEWLSPDGATVAVRSRRLVSFTQRAVAAVHYQVEPLSGPTRVVVQSELVANEEMPGLAGDPRLAAVIDAPLQHVENEARMASAILMHRTRSSKLRVAVAMDHLVSCPAAVRQHIESRHDLARLTLSTKLNPGQRLSVVKFVAHGWSSERSRPAVHDQVEGALEAVLRTGWEDLQAEQRAYLDDFWARADVEVDGDDEIQQAVRFALFHVLQAGARAEGQPIPAKGLTGTGYDGHAFWDTEMFVLPVLTHVAPAAAAAALRWRHATLDKAQDRARELGLRGAAFPWRTIGGRECSGYWPAGTAAFHVNADIAAAAEHYADAAGDAEFDAGPGLDLLVNTARLWCSLGHYDAAGAFRIDGVTGPDEYSALADNNLYTNLMAQRNLQAAAAAARRHQRAAADRLGVASREVEDWLAAADAMTVPFDQKLGVHPQAEGFTEHQEWDFASTGADQYPLLLHVPYFDLYRKQVVKQADLVLAMLLRPECFTPEQKARNFAYYERLTVRDSSLSACSQSVMAAEVGHLGLAYDYLGEAALMDLDDLRHDTRNGLHIASLAGAWISLVWGLGGMRRQGGRHTFAPRLPAGLTRLAFAVGLRGSLLRVEVTRDGAPGTGAPGTGAPGTGVPGDGLAGDGGGGDGAGGQAAGGDGEGGRGYATYLLTGAGDVPGISHYGEPLELSVGEPQTRPIPRAPIRPRPSQPPGREPPRRR